jgi:haloalkane dehalogenase
MTNMTHYQSLPPSVRELYPFESRFLMLHSGHRMHYLDEGTGPVLLMLHGNPTWSFYYRDLVLSLRNQYRCIVPDHVGCGLSEKPEKWSYSIRDHSDNVAELLAFLKLGHVTLVTHDWGGPIGFLAAVQAPAQFSRFITFNTGVTMLRLPRMLTILRGRVLGPLVIRGLNGFLHAGFMNSAANGSGLSAAVREGYMAPYDSWAKRVALLRFVQEIPVEKDHANQELLSRLEMQLQSVTHQPHLVIWGSKDPVFHRDYLEAWRARFPNAEVHELANASHWVVDEAHERIVPLVRSFLSRTA